MRSIICIVLASALLIPVATATWFTAGTYEPSTTCDQDTGCVVPNQPGRVVGGGYMFTTPPDSPSDGLRVYFNGYQGYNNLGINPNNEVIGSRHEPTPAFSVYAWLGIWKDCNKDGYIGAAAGALDIYETTLGIDAALCPDGEAFNRGGWVYEFLWIGNGDFIAGSPHYPSADDERWINDTEAYVWHDNTLPGEITHTSSCPITPLPSGTTSSTGGALAYADCTLSRRVANSINTADNAAGLGIGFEDPASPQRSNSPLNQHTPVNLFGNPYGGPDHSQCDWQTGLLEFNSQQDRDCAYDAMQDYDPENDKRAFDVWDCSDPGATSVDDPTGGTVEEDGTFFTLPSTRVFVAEDPTHASFYDGLNATERGLYGAQGFVIGPGGAGGVGQATLGDGSSNGGDRTCANDQGGAAWFIMFPGVERGGSVHDTATGNGRSVTDTPMNFLIASTMPRGRTFSNAVVTNPADGGVLFSKDVEQDLENATGGDTGDHLNATLGEGYEAPGVFSAVASRPGWFGTGGWFTLGVTINRHTLEPESAQYSTYYATIGSATFATGAKTARDNAPSIYGNEWCNGNFATDEVDDGFNCDRSTWWATADVPEQPPLSNGNDVTTRAGDPYHLRDIDCSDGAVVRGVKLYASLVQFSPTGPCMDALS